LKVARAVFQLARAQQDAAIPELNLSGRRAGALATGATVAVKVTCWPAAEGVAEVVTSVTLSAWLTVCVVVPLLLLKFRSPRTRP